MDAGTGKGVEIRHQEKLNSPMNIIENHLAIIIF